MREYVSKELRICIFIFLVFPQTTCCKRICPSSTHKDFNDDQDQLTESMRGIVLQLGPRIETDSPPADLAAREQEERQERVDENKRQIEAFYERQAQVTPAQLLANIENAKQQLNYLRKLNAQSFAVHFFSDINCFAERLFFYSRLEYYQDVVKLLLQNCLDATNQRHQEIITTLNEFLFGEDPGIFIF